MLGNTCGMVQAHALATWPCNHKNLTFGDLRCSDANDSIGSGLQATLNQSLQSHYGLFQSEENNWAWNLKKRENHSAVSQAPLGQQVPSSQEHAAPGKGGFQWISCAQFGRNSSTLSKLLSDILSNRKTVDRGGKS